MTSDRPDRPRNLALALARRVWDQRWAIGIAVLAALVVALTVTVRSTDLLPGEGPVARWIFAHAGGTGEAISRVLEVTMDTKGAPILFAALIPVTWWTCGRFAVLAFVVSGGFTAIVSVIDLASRPRPIEGFAFGDIVIGKGGYPSGHVIYSVMVLGMLAYLLSRSGVRSKRRVAAVWGLVTVVVLMGPSRIVEMAHWPADVTGGYLIGLTLLLSTIWAHDHIPPWIGPRFPRLYSVLMKVTPPRPRDGPSA
jgi:undecaprenyl-diphosphatase